MKNLNEAHTATFADMQLFDGAGSYCRICDETHGCDAGLCDHVRDVLKGLRAEFIHLVQAADPQRRSILEEIARERVAQDAQWGGPAHDDARTAGDWLYFVHKQLQRATGGLPWSMNRGPLVKAAALCIAAIESMDRRKA